MDIREYAVKISEIHPCEPNIDVDLYFAAALMCEREGDNEEMTTWLICAEIAERATLLLENQLLDEATEPYT